MIVYTDLFGRTRNYSLPLNKIKEIENGYGIKIHTSPHPDAKVYWGDKFKLNHYKKMPNLKWIHLSKTGYGKFDFPPGVIVTNTPNSSEGVAEYALSIILHLLRGLDRMTSDRKSFDSNIDYILPFNKVKCLIVGYGNIGKKLEKLIKSVEMEADIIDKSNFSNLDYKVKDYNFIINCLPLNNSTKECFNSSIFSHVIQNEPLSKKDKHHQNLIKTNNLIISPHIANAIENSLDNQIKEFIFNLLKYKQNKLISNIKI